MTCDELQSRWHLVLQRIEQLADKYRRDASDIQLLAVSKFHPPETIDCLHNAGQIRFGENYVQELMAKSSQLPKTIEWHFIGPLQSNKCKEVSQSAFMMHSLDRLKLVSGLAYHRPDHWFPLKVCLQVNIDDETTKSGVKHFDNLLALAEQVLQEPKLELVGLMSIPAPTSEVNAQRFAFAKLADFRARLEDHLSVGLPVLSIGMSSDLEAAIAEGATIVRIGTDIFGPRLKQS